MARKKIRTPGRTPAVNIAGQAASETACTCWPPDTYDCGHCRACRTCLDCQRCVCACESNA